MSETGGGAKSETEGKVQQIKQVCHFFLPMRDKTAQDEKSAKEVKERPTKRLDQSNNRQPKKVHILTLLTQRSLRRRTVIVLIYDVFTLCLFLSKQSHFLKTHSSFCMFSFNDEVQTCSLLLLFLRRSQYLLGSSYRVDSCSTATTWKNNRHSTSSRVKLTAIQH